MLRPTWPWGTLTDATTFCTWTAWALGKKKDKCNDQKQVTELAAVLLCARHRIGPHISIVTILCNSVKRKKKKTYGTCVKNKTKQNNNRIMFFVVGAVFSHHWFRNTCVDGCEVLYLCCEKLEKI